MPVFDPVDTSLKFPDLEARVLAFWKGNDIFHKSLRQREGRPTWVFYEGPPTANGKPHPGHVLTRVVKDLFPRYKTMLGFCVPRKAGWDTHGLPVEVEVEKELKISGKQQIEEYGVERFVRKCVDSVFRYTDAWEELTERIGFWIDLPEAYVTYHQSYVESVWWSLQQLYNQKLLYQGHKILPWCPRCRTALSSHEVGLGYETVEDPSVYITFRCEDWEQSKTSFLAWTTTPWTLPSNAGLAVKADTPYSHVQIPAAGETLIMASALVPHVMGKLKYEIVKTEPGSALVGRRYQPLFDWWQGKPEQRKKAWHVAEADFVTLDTGTGIVHIAPAFGADDYTLGQKVGFPTIQLVDAGGNFTPECGPFAGRFVKDADDDIVKDLRARRLLLRRETYKHDYPFCWRCDAPLIYFARQCWFIRTTREVPRMLENNRAIKWYPEHIRDGRFGNFLETNVDWALSRERYWGTPLPIWQCPGCHYTEAVGSLAELKTKHGVTGLDAFDKEKAADPSLNEHLRVHKPWIDEVEYDCPVCSLRLKRVTEVVDCWYDSGAMPFAQWGYPHAPGSKERFAQAFPADFISEAIDQTRGWFYSLLAESTLLSDPEAQTETTKPFVARANPQPYKVCVVLGHVCDEKGEKMSKSKGNYLDPAGILKEEGADALRWFFYSCNNPWTNSRFSRAAVREAQKEFLIKLWNVYSFFTIYANLDGFTPGTCGKLESCLITSKRGAWTPLRGGHREVSARGELDRWILAELYRTVAEVRRRLDDYDIYDAAGALNAFAESLSNWYVRRSRERFWRSWKTPDRSAPEDLDKQEAYWTLYECLTTLAQTMAPFVPFTAEELWQNLARKPLGDRVPESVHLCVFPEADPKAADPKLADEMALVRDMSSLGRAARAAAKIKTRQPLARAVVIMAAGEDRGVIEKHEQVIRDELNVKKLEFDVDASKYVTQSYELNFKLIGQRVRDKVPQLKEAVSKMAPTVTSVGGPQASLLVRLADGTGVTLAPEEYKTLLKAREGFAASSGRHGVVILDTHLTDELREEGFARELVKLVNGFRGDLNLKYEQRIKLAVKGGAKLEQIAGKFEEYIRGETLAVELRTGETPTGWKTCEAKVEGEAGTIALIEA